MKSNGKHRTKARARPAGRSATGTRRNRPGPLPARAEDLPEDLMTDRALAASGLFITEQRRCILRDLQSRADHPDVDMVYDRVRHQHPTLTVYTIYRNMNRFADVGLVQRIPAPTRRTRFDGNPALHDHFACLECERILDVDAPPNTLNPILDHPEVHVVHGVQRIYLGRCTHCREGTASPDAAAIQSPATAVHTG